MIDPTPDTPIYVDQTSGRRYTVDASGPRWLDPAPSHQAPPKKRRALPWVLGGAGVLLLLGMCSAFINGDTDDASATKSTKVTPSTPAATHSRTVASAPAAAPAASTPPPATSSAAEAGTVSQRNALRTAENYLSIKGFSRLGLISQLSSQYGDGFSKADATWAVDHLKVNWNEQAVRAGKAYLDMRGFSRTGLIQQLSSEYGDKFTKAQATYAADHLGL